MIRFLLWPLNRRLESSTSSTVTSVIGVGACAHIIGNRETVSNCFDVLLCSSRKQFSYQHRQCTVQPTTTPREGCNNSTVAFSSHKSVLNAVVGYGLDRFRAVMCADSIRSTLLAKTNTIAGDGRVPSWSCCNWRGSWMAGGGDGCFAANATANAARRVNCIFSCHVARLESHSSSFVCDFGGKRGLLLPGFWIMWVLSCSCINNSTFNCCFLTRGFVGSVWEDWWWWQYVQGDGWKWTWNAWWTFAYFLKWILY